MGLLDQVLGSVLGQQGYDNAKGPMAGPSGGILGGGQQGSQQGGMSPIMMALMALLSSGALGRGGAGAGGGLGDLLGGLTGRSGSGQAGGRGSGSDDMGGLGHRTGSGMASDAGGLGGMGELLKGFQNSGHGEAMQSWIGPGENREISPDQLGEALGRGRVDELSRQTGMSHGDLLSELSRMLPTAVDRLTPQGRLPNDDEVSKW